MATNKQATTQDLVAMLQSQTKQDKGLGYMWSQSTHAVGTTFGMLGSLADAGNQLAVQAKRNAVMANLESSKEICTVLGIEATGLESLTTAEAIVEYICSRR
jgi:ABC-type phosphate transport system auxiliary subunit